MQKRGSLVLLGAAVLAVLLILTGASAFAAFTPDDHLAQPGPTVTAGAPDADDADTDADAERNPERAINALAAEFGVSPDEIRARHDAGQGFGELYRAYDLARATGQTVDAVLAQRAAGQGWGELYRAAGLKPGGRGLGALLGGGHGKTKPGKP